MGSESLQALATWKESLFRLNENKFLNIVRLYVGLIKTPYNKERLVSDLVSFLYKEEHKQTIINLLSNRDILFLSAVYFLQNVTNDTLLSFFNGEFTAFYLYDYIDNLEERLLLYRYFDERSKKEYLAINPLLQTQIESLLSISTLLPFAKKEKEINEEDIKIELTTSLFGAWYAFVSQNPDACRADGSFKKKTLAILETSFYGIDTDFLQSLNTSLVHLGLFFHDGPNLCISENKWKSFCALDYEMQRIYICIASFRRFPRETLLKYAQFLKALIDNVPQEGFIKDTLYRLSFLLKTGQKEEKKESFFANVLKKAQGISTEEDTFSEQALIDKMVYFGLLKIIGKDREEQDILCANNIQQEEIYNIPETNEEAKPFITITAGFSVTFLTKVSLETMLSLVCCMNLTSYDTVCCFEITRASCMRGFDKGEGSKSLLNKLEKATGKPLAQNLTFSINEWYETYNSASLYHGYVLQVAQEKIIQIENSSILSPRIKKTLAPGVYLFDFETREEILEAIEKSTLDFIGLPKNDLKETTLVSFSTLPQKCGIKFIYTSEEKTHDDISTEHLQKMKKDLENLDISVEQKEGLLERIDRKLILTSKQLVGETVRTEKTEAGGIDFMGKIQVIEQAIASSNMIEITNPNGSYVGRPLKIEKKEGDASIVVGLEDSKTITLLIGQARNVRRFRQPLF